MSAYHSSESIRRALATAAHFGFRPLDTVAKEHSRETPIGKSVHLPYAERRLDSAHGLITSGIAQFLERGFGSAHTPMLFSTLEEVPRSDDIALGLHIVGVEKSIAEALLIQTARSLLDELGYTDYTIHINSLGDRESTVRYARELTNFFRKRIDEMPLQARELMKEHVLSSLAHLIEKNHELAERSPSHLEYLSDQSRKHFRELVEYLEMTDASYEIDTRLTGHHQCYPDAVFAIDMGKDAPISVRGGRYDEFVRRGVEDPMPAAGAVVVFKSVKIPSRQLKLQRPKLPSVFLAHLGFGPKIRTLILLEDLKRANIGAYQELASNSITDQLNKAEHYNVRLSLILGQKEYVENTVIVRDMVSRSQESVPSTTLIHYLKKAIKA